MTYTLPAKNYNPKSQKIETRFSQNKL